MTLLFMSGVAEAGDTHRRRPLFLRFDSPRPGGIQYSSGWELSLSMTPIQQDFGIANPGVQAYPLQGQPGVLLFQDLDGCPSMIDASCPVIPGDELFARFTSDFDLPFVVDREGDETLRNALSSTVARPVFVYNGIEREAGVRLAPPPPPPGSVPPTLFLGPDGVGYGANDDLPGLVLLSNVGVGRVLDLELGSDTNVTGFEQRSPLQARNLAGLMTRVAFDVRVNARRTVLSTSMLVPPEMFTPFTLVDFCVTDEGPFCIGLENGVVRIDGGPIVPFEIVEAGSFDITTASPPFAVDVQVRAVMVQGDAPTFVDDCDANNVINARDLVCMGYQLLSNEAVVDFRTGGFFLECEEAQAQTLFEGPGGNRVTVDFDGFPVIGQISCPSGGGRISPPPD